MWKILAAILLGGFVGYFINFSEKTIKCNGKIQLLLLFFLIFFMGIGIGGNQEIINNLASLGIQSAIYAFLSSIFSIVFVCTLYHFLWKKELKK